MSMSLRKLCFAQNFTYYAGIMLDAFAILLCWHNWLKPTNETLIKLTFENSLIYRLSIECTCLIMRVEVVFSIGHFVIIHARKKVRHPCTCLQQVGRRLLESLQ